MKSWFRGLHMEDDKVERPTKVQSEPYWDYNEVIRFVEDECGIEVRDYHKYYDSENDDWERYMDFWHWVIDNLFYDVHNGCFRNANIYENMINENNPNWIREILGMIYNQFAEKEMLFWIEW